MWPRSTITAAGTVIHGLRSRSAQTENAKRPPGRSDAAHLAQRRRRVAPEDVAEAGEHAVDARVREVEPLGVEHAVLDVRQAELGARRGAPPRPCSASGRSRSAGRAAPSRGAARKPVSPVPAASSRIVCPGCGSSRSTSHSLTGRVDAQSSVPAAVPARRHLLPAVAAGVAARRLRARAAAASSAAGRLPLAGRGVRAHLLGGGRAGDHRGDRRLRGEAADRDVEQPPTPRSRANASSASIRVPAVVVDVEPAAGQPRALGRRLAAPVLAR